MKSARSSDRFYIDLLDIDSLPRTVRPAFLEWARALEEVSTAVPAAGGDREPAAEQASAFHARVRLEAARRHALRICVDAAADGHPRVRDVMVYLSWSPDSAPRPTAANGEIALDLPKPTIDGDQARH